ncbi:MAG TPA: polysaccharide deacetylase family protein [Kiritimatiellia bacterium]|nr:polysaccharide deacetylase family protein [Kiritimatiellia bacterium]
MNIRCKQAGLSLARMFGLIAMARRSCGALPRILAYHGAESALDPLLNYDGFHVPADAFRKQMEHLARYYRVVPLGDIVNAAVKGSSVPPLSVALTFDDGYRNNVEVVAPILESFGFPATFFVTTGFIDGTSRPWWDLLRAIVVRTGVSSLAWGGTAYSLVSQADRVCAVIAIEAQCRGMKAADREAALNALASTSGVDVCEVGPPIMTWIDVRALLKRGFDVGPHTVTHISLGVEGPEAVARELAESAVQLSSQTGVTPRLCSYPYGGAVDVPAGVESQLGALGFAGAVTSTEGLVLPGCDVFRLPRLNVTGKHVGAVFESLVSGFTAWVK